MTQTWWHIPIVPLNWKTETVGSLELRNFRPAWYIARLERKERKRTSGHKGENKKQLSFLYD